MRDGALAAAFLGLLALIVSHVDEANRISLAGDVRVIDGDTLALADERIRLKGIDAPELAQTCRDGETVYACGEKAKTALAALTGSAQVECSGHGHDKYARLLATCVAGGRDLNGAMVRAGHAVAFGDYADEERFAQAERRGIWAGTFDPPDHWRRQHDGMEEAPHTKEDMISRLIDRAKGWFSGV